MSQPMLSQSILETVKSAEEEAGRIRKAAQDEARDILRSVEEARAHEERTAAADRRAEANNILRKQSEVTGQEIEKIKAARSRARETARKDAETRIPLAVEKVLEGLHSGYR